MTKRKKQGNETARDKYEDYNTNKDREKDQDEDKHLVLIECTVSTFGRRAYKLVAATNWAKQHKVKLRQRRQDKAEEKTRQKTRQEKAKYKTRQKERKEEQQIKNRTKDKSQKTNLGYVDEGDEGMPSANVRGRVMEDICWKGRKIRR